MWRILLLLFSSISIFACTLSARAGWFSYDSYEDCMLGRMKGQAPTMYSTADKACKKEFHVEVSIYDRSSVKWEFETDGHNLHATITITITQMPEEYEVTTGEFAFAAKWCKDVTEADFGKPITAKFRRGVATVAADFLKQGEPQLPVLAACARAISFSGVYK
jgi:hypothetical protein